MPSAPAERGGLCATAKVLLDQKDRRTSPVLPDADSVHPRMLPVGANGRRVVKIVCLDLEGVMVPEIWIAFADRVGIPELCRTTRDEPDYDKLMCYRLDLLRTHQLGLNEIQEVIAGLDPMPGAKEFLDDLRASYQVIILSDTFYEFGLPFMRKLGLPTLFCHRLEADADGMLVNYRLRMPDQKRAAVNAFKALNFEVIAAGDSYNDTAMLGAADAGILMHPPDNVVREFPQYPIARDYPTLRKLIDDAL
jgi:phosphoserine / homoserine phosphotransferase